MVVDRRIAGTMRLHEVLQAARDRGASDAHLAVHEVPSLRIDGELTPLELEPLGADEIEIFLGESLDQRARQDLTARGTCDAAWCSEQHGALRLHVFRGRLGLRCAIRFLPAEPPLLESLGVPEAVGKLAFRRSGLVLVVGPTGSGKTTLLAAMIDALNRREARHIVILEDPIEYLHRANRSVLAQCEIGRDIADFGKAIHAALRADPDVIVIGELRDADSIRSALTAAETGHLVMASLHTIDASNALDRIVDAFPSEGRDQIRIQLSQTLVAVIAIRLVPRARGTGRRAALELLIGSDAVRNLIREGKTHHLRSAMQTGRALGMQTLEMHLCELVMNGEIGLATARAFAERPAELKPAEMASQ